MPAASLAGCSSLESAYSCRLAAMEHGGCLPRPRNLGAAAGALVGALLVALCASGLAGATLPGRPGRLYFTVSPQGFGAQISWIDVARPSRVHVVRWLTGAGELGWAPDGERVAYTSAAGLFTANADGSGRRQLTVVKPNSGTFEADPAWSPDGKWIAFTHEVPMHPAIYVIRADGAKRHRLAAGEVPSWSPRGHEIAFQGGDVSRPQLYLIGRDGSGRRRITRSSGHDILPDWSPDGRRIVFVSDRDGNDEIYVVDRDGSHPRRLTREPAYDTTAAWSPDGRWIVFAEGRTRRDFGLYLIRPDGTGERRLTSPGVNAQVPSWQPLPRR